VLLPAGAVLPTHDAGQEAAARLHAIVTELAGSPAADRTWLLLVALSAAYPLDEDVRAAQRQLQLASVDESCIWLLEQAHEAASAARSGAYRLELVRQGVVVDVDYAAKHDLQTGIQRVVRHLVPRWHRDHGISIAVWTEHGGGLRAAEGDERERVLHWQGPLHRDAPPPRSPAVLAPWRSQVVLPEVPGVGHSLRLAALAQHSGNAVAVVGYDCIPVVSADVLPAAEPSKFVRYLSLVKHVDLVVGISRSAAAEFSGFTRALATQGLPGPRVTSCSLATEVTLPPAPVLPPTDGPLEVLVVGSHEPRKNHLAVLHAAEVLWREGHRFRLRFLGGSGWSTAAFDARLAALTAQGRDVTAERGLSDAALWDAFRRASFSVFPSLHEGYGLPVVESLALGTPVIGTGYGSIAEIAADGGVVLVDPRDDDAIVDAVRRLLTEPDELVRLRAEALARPSRSWDDYARELWELAAVRS
jgi:glycosyltransferase involved in cell wall biosynthesis